MSWASKTQGANTANRLRLSSMPVREQSWTKSYASPGSLMYPRTVVPNRLCRSTAYTTAFVVLHDTASASRHLDLRWNSARQAIKFQPGGDRCHPLISVSRSHARSNSQFHLRLLLS
jgi:hypothetical protein